MRILVVTPTVPYPPSTGGRQRTFLLIEALRRIADVDVIVIGGQQQVRKSEWDVLQRDYHLLAAPSLRARGELWPWPLVRWIAPHVVDRLAHNLGARAVDYRVDDAVAGAVRDATVRNRYAAIVVRYVRPALKAGVFDLAVPVVVDVDDLEIQVYADRLNAPGTPRWQRPILRRHLQQLATFLPTTLARAAHVWVSCDEDAPVSPHERVSVLPNIPFPSGNNHQRVANHSIGSPMVIVVADFGHPPNRRGVDWFVTNVWPQVRAELPSASLKVTGGGVDLRHRRQWSRVPGVLVIGFVADLAAEYAAASVAVAPLFEGGGTKIKVLEALRFGLPVVATSHAIRGYREYLKDNEALLLADDPASFSRAVLALLGDDRLRRRIGAIGASVIASRFSRAIFNQAVSRTLARVTDTTETP